MSDPKKRKWTSRSRRRARTSAKDVERRLRETCIEGFGFGLQYLKEKDVDKLRKAFQAVTHDGAFWNDIKRLAMMSQSTVEFKNKLLGTKR